MERYITDMQDISCWETVFGDWNVYRRFYGDAICVEADASFEEDAFRVALGMGIALSDCYGVRLSREKGRIAVTLYRQVLRPSPVAYVWLDDLGIVLDKNQRFHLALRRENNTYTVELDGKIVLRYETCDPFGPLGAGYCGYTVYPIRGNVTKISNFTITGSEQPEPAKAPVQKPQPYHYEMCLGAEGTLPAYWTDAHDSQGFRVKDGALTSPVKGYAESLIYQFDKDPKLDFRFSVEQLNPEEGEFGIILRKAPMTAFVQVGYSVERGCWYVQDEPAVYDCYNQIFEGSRWIPELGKVYDARLVAEGDMLTLTVDGVCVLSATGLRQCNYGKTGLYSNNALWKVHSLQAEFSSGVTPADGALSYCVDDDTFQASMEVEIAPNGDLVGITKASRYVSSDRGLSFRDAADEYAELDVKKYYQTILRLHDGSYLQVVASEYGAVKKSYDLKNWTTISHLPFGIELEEESHIFHTGSMTEIRMPDGNMRLFMPVAVGTRESDIPVFLSKAHDTYVNYSDDGGKTWKSSELASKAFPQTQKGILVDWAETKVINCDDGTLRLYCSRNCSLFFGAVVSRDLGQTWTELVPIPQIQCSKASYGIAKDTENPNVWYVACVNDVATKRGHIQHRTRLSLYRTENGRDWQFLTDVERFGTRFLDQPDMEKRPLYQIVDPAVTVDEDYIYVTWGASLRGARGAVFVDSKANPAGSGRLSHNEQRSHIARFEKAKLAAQPWSAATVADMALLDADLSGEMW